MHGIANVDSVLDFANRRGHRTFQIIGSEFSKEGQRWKGECFTKLAKA